MEGGVDGWENVRGESVVWVRNRSIRSYRTNYRKERKRLVVVGIQWWTNYRSSNKRLVVVGIQ